jgi:hypothetical protein
MMKSSRTHSIPLSLMNSLLLMAFAVSGCSDAGKTGVQKEQLGSISEVSTSTPTTTMTAPANGTANGTAATKRVTFTETTAEFPNPERGYAGWAGDLVGLFMPGARAEIAAGRPLMRAQVRLDNFRTTELTSAFLTALDEGFGQVRSIGGKIVLRFKYNSPDTLAGPAPDASIDLVLRHIAQLAPILQKNADVIAFVEGGFIGAWGEWHSSASGLTSPENKALIRDALIRAVPQNRMIAIRSPTDVMSWFGTPVSATEAFAGTPRARIGIHNDCYLSGPTDVGTFPSQSVRDFTAALVSRVPFGAETCDVGQTLRNSCADILREGRRYALTYLNWYGNQRNFLPRWQAERCDAEVTRSFGYRFVVNAVEHGTRAAPGAAVSLTMSVRNVGWARLYNARGFVVRLVNVATRAYVELPVSGIDARSWTPLLATELPSESSGRFVVPSDLAVGTYEVWIGLPDASPSIANDPRYAIRPANADDGGKGQRWDGASGRFATGSTIVVQRAGSSPGEETILTGSQAQ